MTLEKFLPLFIEGLQLNLIAKTGYGFECSYRGIYCRGCPLEHIEARWCCFDGSFNSSHEMYNYLQHHHPELLI